MEINLGDEPITIGRAPEADIVIPDERASRIHCAIRRWDDEYFIRDLKSRNGTYVNDEKIEVAALHDGDRIRVGSTLFTVETGRTPGASTALQEVEQEMADGKGYETILREIVDTSHDEK